MSNQLLQSPTKKERKKIWEQSRIFWAGILVVLAILGAGWKSAGAFGDIVEGPTIVKRLAERVGLVEREVEKQQFEQRLQTQHLHEELQRTREDLRWIQLGRPLPPVEPHELPTSSPSPISHPTP